MTSSRLHLFAISAVAGLFVWFHWPAMRLLADYANNDPNWSHAFVVPFVSGYLLYARWPQIAAAAKQGASAGSQATGVGLTLLAVIWHLWALQAPSSIALGYSMIFGLLGITLALFGRAALAQSWVAICYLVFAVRITTFWERFAGAMQRTATDLAGGLVNVSTGFSHLRAEVDGSVMALYHRGMPLSPPLSVDEACSGLRMLMAIVAVAAAMAALANMRPWRALAQVAAAIPIAILVNVLRLAALAFLYPKHPNLATGDFHVQLGAAMFVPAFALLIAVQICLTPTKRQPS